MSSTQVENKTSDAALHPLLEYKQFEETKYEQVDWADLATLDLSKFDQPGGKKELAEQLCHAIEQIGFFYVTNFGLSQTQIDCQFAIGKEIFALSTEEKLKYRADLEHGGYNGYKPMGIREIAPGQFDNTEVYNIPKFIPELDRTHPPLIREHWEEIEKFGRHVDDEIVSKLLVLLAIILELPEEYFLNSHRYSKKSDSHLRYMKYRARTPEENQRIGNVWLKGHTDFGSLTLLFRQPVAALQVRAPQGEWKWVKPYPGSITVNIADALSFLTNGFLKSSIHRVVVPPPDQAHIDRLGVLYFVRPGDDLVLKTVPSPVLERLGLLSESDAPVITAGDWVKTRVANNVNMKGVEIAEWRGDVEQEVIGGMKVKYYA